MHEEFFGCARFAGGPAFAPADTKPQYIPDTTFDSEHVRLELNVDLKKQTLSGRCTTTLTILQDKARTLLFHALAMKIRRVACEGAPVKFKHDGKELEVTLPKPQVEGTRLKVAIDYAVRDPKAGIRFIRPDRKNPKRPVQVWTQGQADDSRLWFPCRDVPAEKVTSEVIVTIPEGFRAVSNGALLTETAGRGTRTFHWKMSVPHSVYLMTLTVGRFAEIREEWDGIPITFYCEKNRVDDARRGFAKTPAVIEFFSRSLGVRYPYEKYAQIAAAEFPGGMENTSATTQTEFALIDKTAALDTDFDHLVAHEAAHQWFGDMVTCADWSHAWLNESFATYMELLFQLHDKGADEFLYKLWKYAGNYLDEHADYQRPIMTRGWRESFQMFDRHLYEKGACVLHFFRRLLGDEGWWRGLKYYLEKHAFRSVETNDLIEAFRAATGKNLDLQFAQWITRAGHPDLAVRYSWDAGRKEASFWIVQKQALGNGHRFSLPLDFRLDDRSYTVELKEKEHRFAYKLPREPRMALVDPDLWIAAKTVDFTKPAALWKNQLTGAKNPVSRIEAAQAIAGWGTEEAVALLAAAFRREKFWGVQAEIARAVGKIRTAPAFQALRGMLSHKNAKVRRSVVDTLGDFRDAASAALLSAVLKRDPSYGVRADAVRSLARTGDPRARAGIAHALKTDSWIDVIRAAAVDATAIATGRAESVLPFAEEGRPIQVRLAAVRQLARLGRGNPRVTQRLLEIAAEPNEFVPVEALRSLGRLGDPAAVKRLRELAKEDPGSRNRAFADRAARMIRMGLES